MSAGQWLVGGGAMGEVVRAKDWSHTALGPLETWPAALRTTVNLCLASNFPISLAWGPQRVQIYNDGYWPICAAKHPHSMGQDFKECWFSAWPVIGEAFERASAGETAFLENQRLFVDRLGYLEETFFTFSFSPIRDETGAVAGLFHPVIELTQQSLAERRLQVLRDVAASTMDATSVEQALALLAQALAQHDLDLPFVLFYRVDAEGREARLAERFGLPPDPHICPERVNLQAPEAAGWPLAAAARSTQPLEVADLAARWGALTCGPYPEPPQVAFVLPLGVPGREQPLALLVAGVSARRPLDAPYRTFYQMLATAVAGALAKARAYEEERKRAEALAELDRAKTAFFSNVSHEFRTPLTLILGPLTDELGEPAAGVPPERRERLAVAQRNSLRLLKLVNTLLDFSRIEAGRVQAAFEPVELGAFTADLAGNFRSACERAGLALNVQCPPLPEPVYVDREMWEKIVLNLLSNAFKFTLAGQIAVTLQLTATTVELAVQDTGTGIPADQLPHVFDRFYRVQGAPGRTHEGSGIGLALVRELAVLHGGALTAASVPGQGSTFTVSLPRGHAHLPPERLGAPRTLASTALGAAPFVEEALRWLPAAATGAAAEDTLRPEQVPMATAEPAPAAAETAARPHILWADDNADMRDYVRRLLADRYEVEAVADGREVLAAVQRRLPDLVLADVMMPRLDGFGLLRALRADERTRTLPIVLLSARAGEEARIEGLQAGADNYLVKPFSARELLAVVGAQLEIAAVRREAATLRRDAQSAAALQAANAALRDSRRAAVNLMKDAVAARELAERQAAALRQQEEQLRLALSAGAMATWDWDVASGRVTWNDEHYRMLGYAVGAIVPSYQAWADRLHPDDRAATEALLQQTMASGSEYTAEFRVCWPDGSLHWLEARGRVERDGAGAPRRSYGVMQDITARKAATAELAAAHRQLQDIIDNTPAIVYAFDREERFVLANATIAKMLNSTPAQMLGKRRHEFMPQADADWHEANDRKVLEAGRALDFEEQSGLPGHTITWLTTKFPLRDAAGRIYAVGGISADITERKAAEEALRRQAQMLAQIHDAIIVTDLAGHITHWNTGAERLYGYTAAEVLNRHVEMLYFAEDVLQMQVNVIEPLLATGSHELEMRAPTKSGAPVWVHLALSLLRDEAGAPCGLIGYSLDITARKAAEAALRASEERLALAASGSRLGLFDWNIATGEAVGTEQLLQLTGLRTTTTRRTTTTTTLSLPYSYGQWAERVHPKDLPRVEAEIRRCQAERAALEVEYRVVWPDGSVHWMAVRGVFQYDGQDQPLHLLGIAMEITERKQTEEALRESERRFRTVLEGSRDAIYRLNVQTGSYVYVSPAVERILGYTPAEFAALAGQGASALAHPDDLPTVLAGLVRLEAVGACELEYRLRAKAGAYRWIANQLSLTRDDAGRPLYRDGTFRDVTERKQAEAALRASEEQFRLLIQNLVSAVALIDEHGAFAIVNRSFLRLFELAEDTPLMNVNDRDWSQWQVFDEQGALLDVDEHPVRKAALTRQAVRNQLIAVQAPTHPALKWVLVSAEPLLNAQGQVHRLICSYHDITARKQAEEALRTSGEQLNRAQAIAHLGSWELDLRANRLAWSDEVYRIFGLQPQEFAATYEAFLEHVHPEDRARVDAAYAGSVRDNRDTYEIEHRVVRQDTGAVRFVLERCEHLRDGAGQIVRSLGMVHDITERKLAEMEMRRLAEFPAQNPAPVLRLDALGGLLYANVAALHWLETLGWEVGTPLPPVLVACAARAHGAERSIEEEIVAADGTTLLCTALQPPDADYVNLYALDITARKQAEQERELVVAFLARVNEVQDAAALIRVAAAFFHEHGGCEAVGIRLKQGEDYPYFETRGFPAEFVRMENSLCARDAAGCAVCDGAGHPLLECMCGNVLQRRFDPTQPFFTARGSFWTNNTTELLATSTAADRQARTRNRCNGEGYESVALIALRSGTECLGLLQLNDPRPDRFTPASIALWERLADYLAVALAKLRAEDALRESGERFRAAFEGSAVPMSLTAPDGRLLRVNAAFCQMLGYSEAEMLALHFYEFTYPEDLAVNRAGVQALLAGTQPALRMEKRYLRKDGRVLWGDISSAVVRDASGEPLYMVTHVQDITARKLAEAAVQESEARFRTMANAMPQLAWIARADGFIFWYNQRWYDYTGTTPAQMEGWGWQSVHDPEALPKVLEQWQASIATGTPFEMTFPLRGADGVFRPFLTRGFPLRDPAGRVVQWFGTNTDVDAIQRAEAALRASEERYRSLFQNLQEGFYLAEAVFDGQGRCCDVVYLDVNPAFEQLMGRPREQIVGHRAKELLPDIKSEWLEVFGQVTQTGAAASHQSFSEALQKHFEAFVFRPAPGRIGVLVSDITARVQAEAQLRASEQRFRVLFDTMSEGFSLNEIICDAQGQPCDLRYLAVNPAFEQHTGFKVADVVGRTCRELFPQAEPSWFEQYGRVALTGEPAHFEASFGPLNRWFEVSAYQTEPGRFAVVFFDTTARRQAEAQLREATQRLAYHMDHSPLAVIEWGPDMRLTRWSGEAERIFGWTAAEVLGKRMEDFHWIYQEDEGHVAVVSDELQTGANPRRFSANRNYRKDGSVANCEWYNSSLMDETGNLRSILSLVLDVTQRKQAEEQIQAALAEKEVLLKEVHHRVKNNLQVISSLVSLQADNLADARMRTVFDDVRDRVRSMALIHEKLYESNDLAQVHFADYAASLLHSLWRTYGALAGQVQLRLELAPVPLSIEAAVPCALILNELAGNALKHAFPDGRRGTVTVTLEQDPATGAVGLRVSDDGVGLPAGLDWRQAQSLGLRLVQMLAGQLRGTVETPAQAHAGTEFKVTFNIKENRNENGH